MKSEASPGKNRAGLYKYKYNGKELQDELGLNFYDYGFRNYMPDIGRWGNVDPLAELYVGINPYAYTLNNPVLFLDPDGRYVDDSYIYEKYKKGDHKGEYKNPSLVKAWEIFAKSKSGSAFLSNFARKGQMIAGEKFKGESGKFDKKNIDLNFGTKTQGFADAEASSAVKGSHLQITIGLSEGGDSVAPDLSGFIDDISHEAFVHAESTAFDFYKDGKIDFDNIDNDIVKSINAWIKEDPKTRAGSRSNAMQHNQDERSGISIDKTFSILKEYYRNANIKKSDKQIKTEANYYYNH